MSIRVSDLALGFVAVLCPQLVGCSGRDSTITDEKVLEVGETEEAVTTSGNFSYPTKDVTVRSIRDQLVLFELASPGPKYLTKDEAYLIHGRAKVIIDPNNTSYETGPGKFMAGLRVECFDSNYTSLGYVTSTENIWLKTQVIPLQANMLFKAPADGYYTCKLFGHASPKPAIMYDSVKNLIYLASSDINGPTKLYTSTVSGGWYWGLNKDDKHHDTRTNKDNTFVHKEITQLSLAGNRIGDTAYVAIGPYISPPTTVRQLKIQSAIHLTGCVNSPDEACIPEAIVNGGVAGSAANATANINVVQYNSDNSICGILDLASHAIAVDYDSHHKTLHIFDVADIPLPGCSYSKYKIRTYFKRTDGTALKIERGDVDEKGEFTGYSQSFAYW